MEGRVGTAEFLTGDPIWVYGRGERPPSAGSHLRAAGQGVEEVKEHKAGESHRCGTWGACPVFRDLEHMHRMRGSQGDTLIPSDTHQTESQGGRGSPHSRPHCNGRSCVQAAAV